MMKADYFFTTATGKELSNTLIGNAKLLENI